MLVFDTGGGFLKQAEDAANPRLLELTADSLLRGLQAIGYDAANIGGTDLDVPANLLSRFAARISFPLLSANVVDAAGAAPFAGWVVREVNGVRLGIFGVTASVPARPTTGAGPPWSAQDPVAAARRAVDALRRDCDLVLALSQLGLEGDVRLARAVPGIDIILGGRSRLLTSAPNIVGQTLIVHAGAKGMRLGRLEVAIASGKPGNNWSLRGSAPPRDAKVYAWDLVALDAAIPDHPALAALLDQHRERVRAADLEAQAAALPQPAPAQAAYVGAAACGACHPDQLRQWSRSKHAQAFAALAKKRQEVNPACVRCHVTAYGEPGGYAPGAAGGVDLANVQCESCHGFGREHRGPGRIRGRVSEAICRRCHTSENSPTFRYEPYLRQLGAHAEGYFLRSNAPRQPVSTAP